MWQGSRSSGWRHLPMQQATHETVNVLGCQCEPPAGNGPTHLRRSDQPGLDGIWKVKQVSAASDATLSVPPWARAISDAM